MRWKTHHSQTTLAIYLLSRRLDINLTTVGTTQQLPRAPIAPGLHCKCAMTPVLLEERFAVTRVQGRQRARRARPRSHQTMTPPKALTL